MTVLMEPHMVDRALKQTATIATRAVVDIPAMDAWMDEVERGGTTFNWWLFCGSKPGGWNFKRVTDKPEEYVPIEDGCYVICLRPAKHEGDCFP